MLATGCAGNGNRQAATSTPPPVLTPASSPGPATPTAAAAASVTPRPADALQAALNFFDAFLAKNADACRAQARPCIIEGPEPDSPELGIDVLSEADPQGGGAMVVFGLKPDGAWDYWFGTQQGTYHALKLPAEMRVCASGEGVNVREQPDAGSPAVGQLSDGATVTAERFVLTEPGKIQPSLVSGNGWYQVSGSLSGYIRADFLSVTSLPDCSLHDILIG